MLKAMPDKKKPLLAGKVSTLGGKKDTLEQQGPILGVRFKEMSIERVGYIVKPL